MKNLKFVQIATSTSDEYDENLYGLTAEGEVYYWTRKTITRDFDPEKDDASELREGNKINIRIYGWKKLGMEEIE